jgi:hypothetical protein
MQLRTIYYFFLVSYLMSCNRISKDGVREFIPGTYERRINNEFSKGRDQLTIHPQQGNVYTIEKRSAITRVRNGVELPVQYDTTVWTGIYDEKDKVIYEQQKGKVISFQPKENKLMVGASVYRKVKQ